MEQPCERCQLARRSILVWSVAIGFGVLLAWSATRGIQT